MADKKQSSTKEKLFRLYETKRFTDFCLIGANQSEYLVHKWVLDDNCEYFRKLFEMEKETTRFTFPEGISGQIIDQFVRFLYTDELLVPDKDETFSSPDSVENSFTKEKFYCQLFEVADYFQCPSLQNVTAIYLGQSLSVTTVNDFMNFFKQHSHHLELRKILVEFIAENYHNLVASNFPFEDVGPAINDVLKEISVRTLISIKSGDQFKLFRDQINLIYTIQWEDNDLLLVRVNGNGDLVRTSNGEGIKLLQRQKVQLMYHNNYYQDLEFLDRNTMKMTNSHSIQILIRVQQE